MNKAPKKPNWLEILLKIFLALVILFSFLKLWLDQGNNTTSGIQGTANYPAINLANCLNEKGTMMYGVDTCEFCLTQKKMFGEAFAIINYINCDFDQDICRQKGVKYLPAWEIGGQIITGMQTFDSLASKSGCTDYK